MFCTRVNQACRYLLQRSLLVLLRHLFTRLVCPKVDGLPARIDVQMQMENILSCRRLIRLRQIDPVTLQSRFDSACDLYSCPHHMGASGIVQGINVRNMLLGHNQRQTWPYDG